MLRQTSGSFRHTLSANQGARKAPQPALSSRADDGIRTRDPNLGKVVLYQLSHVRSGVRD
jgi:hypothetical protein